jgi:hypothetical protein
MRLSSRRLAILVVAVLAVSGLLWLARPIERERVVVVPGGSAVTEDMASGAISVAEEPMESAREPVASSTVAETALAVADTEPDVGHVRVLVRAKEDGAPQAHAQVKAFSTYRVTFGGGSRAANNRSKVTDEEGRAELEVAPGVALKVQVIGSRMQFLERELDAPAAGESVELVFELRTREDIRLFGQLVDDESGAPLVGRVWCSTLDSTRRDVQTDDAGRFELTAGSWVPVSAKGMAEGFAPAQFTLSRGYEDPLRPMLVRLSRAAVLEAFGRDRTGAFVDGARVEVATPSQPRPRLPASMIALPTEPASHWTSKTDRNGRAILDDLLPRTPLRVSVSADGWASRSEPEPIVLEPGEHRCIDLVLGRGATISGVLEEASGSPIPRCEVWCEPASDPRPRVFDEGMHFSSRTWTDAGGRFRFEMLPAGLYWIGPAPHSRSNKLAGNYLPLAQVVEVVDEWADLEIVVRVDRGVTIEGQVLDPDGLAARECAVFAERIDGRGYETAETDARGAFTIGPMQDGAWRLSARTLREHAPSAPMNVEGGEHDVVLRLRRGGEIVGEVADARNGAPVACDLDLISSGEGNRLISSTAPGVGEFRLRGLAADTYTITARSRDKRIGITRGIVVREGERVDDVRVELVAGAELSLIYEGPADRAICRVLFDGTPVQAVLVRPGESEKVLVPPGRIELRWGEAPAEHVNSIEVGAGEERTVTLEADS